MSVCKCEELIVNLPTEHLLCWLFVPPSHICPQTIVEVQFIKRTWRTRRPTTRTLTLALRADERAAWTCWALTEDGRRPSGQMSAALADTPPKRRLPLRQTWKNGSPARHPLTRRARARTLTPTLTRPHSLHPLLHQLDPWWRQQQRHTGGWGTGDEEQSSPPLTGGKKFTRSDRNAPTRMVQLTARWSLRLSGIRSLVEHRQAAIAALCQVELSW